MKQFHLVPVVAAALLYSGGPTLAQCIRSGEVDQYTYFVAVDPTDKVTREPGLTSFTVQRSRKGAAEAAYTTPTIAEIDATTMPGVYGLLLDEDTTLDAGDDLQNVALHITQASMEPVTKEICIERPKITIGETVTAANGAADADVERHLGTVVATPTTAGVPEVDTTFVGGQTASAAGAVTFPGTIASTTNITAATGITVSTNSDKTGYSLTQAFPTNFSSMDINATGGVGIDWANVQAPTTTLNLSGTTISTAQQVLLSSSVLNCLPAFGCEMQGALSGTHTSTTADLGAVGTTAPAATTEVVGKTLVIDDKISRVVTAYNTSTGVVTFAPVTGLTLADADQWYLWGTPPSPNATQDAYESLPLTCTIDTATFAGSTTTVGCDLTDVYAAVVTSATGKLSGKELCVTSGAQMRECRFISATTTWNGTTSELEITLTRAMPATLADGVTAIIK